MRKDPPVDVTYLHATWILEQARGKTLLVNDPRGLRELNEHLAVLRFPELTPPTLVTRDTARLASFQREQGGAIVVKPVDGFGGLGVFVVRDGDPNASSIYETSTGAGTRWTMAQKYLPEAVDGDKRILLFDGEPLGAVLRVPGRNEARGNLHVGGRAVKTTIDADDRAIIAAIAPTLRAHGQLLVGIDVIGGRLTEINITSPTGGPPHHRPRRPQHRRRRPRPPRASGPRPRRLRRWRLRRPRRGSTIPRCPLRCRSSSSRSSPRPICTVTSTARCGSTPSSTWPAARG
jgi:glutathione synthase